MMIALGHDRLLGGTPQRLPHHVAFLFLNSLLHFTLERAGLIEKERVLFTVPSSREIQAFLDELEEAVFLSRSSPVK
jgi:hypothetical protein